MSDNKYKQERPDQKHAEHRPQGNPHQDLKNPQNKPQNRPEHERHNPNQHGRKDR